MNPQEVVRLWGAKMQAQPERAERLDTVFKFVVTGEGGGVWRFRCRAPVELLEGEGAADCTMTTSAEDFVAIAEKRLNPQLAYVTGRLALSGEVTRALKLTEIF